MPGVAAVSISRGSVDPVLAQLLAQRRAVDAEHRGGAALVAVAVVEHFDAQRDLEFAQRDLVEVVGAAAVEVADVTAHRVRNVLAPGRAGAASSEERRGGKECGSA